MRIKDKEFKEEIGAFIISFSELEFHLAFLCSMTEFDLRKKDNYLVKYMSYSFSQKINQITDFIDEHLLELSEEWSELKNEMGQLNRERRFLAHGFMSYFLPKESITTHIKEKGKIVTKNQTLEDIKNLRSRLSHLKTGEERDSLNSLL